MMIKSFAFFCFVWVFSCVTFTRSPMLSENELLQLFLKTNGSRDVQGFSGGSMVKKPPAKAGDTTLIPGS